MGDEQMDRSPPFPFPLTVDDDDIVNGEIRFGLLLFEHVVVVVVVVGLPLPLVPLLTFDI